MTNYVRAQNARIFSGPIFAVDEIIGEYEIAAKPTFQFRKDMQEFVKRNLTFLRATRHESITHEQANVLDFLNEKHLAEILKTLVACLEEKKGKAAASAIGQQLIKHCRVAALNRNKFLQNKPKEGGQHWLKAFVTGKLLDFTQRDSIVQHEVHFDDDTHELFLIDKSTFGSRSSGSAYWPLAAPAMKKQRTTYIQIMDATAPAEPRNPRERKTIERACWASYSIMNDCYSGAYEPESATRVMKK